MHLQLQPIKVNGTVIPEAAILNELEHHKEASDPLDMAISTLILRELLSVEAQRLELEADSEEELIALLLQRQVQLPTLTEAECLRHYEQNQSYFTVGAAAEVDHILLQATPGVALEALHKKSQELLEEVAQATAADSSAFARLARQYSNCPSSEEGGYLGVLQKGQTVPEFEEVVFRAEVGAVHPAVVESRFGFHIVRVMKRNEGQLLPYEQVAEAIREAITQSNQHTAWRQYAQHLMQEAKIEGFDYEQYLDENVFLG